VFAPTRVLAFVVAALAATADRARRIVCAIALAFVVVAVALVICKPAPAHQPFVILAVRAAPVIACARRIAPLIIVAPAPAPAAAVSFFVSVVPRHSFPPES